MTKKAIGYIASHPFWGNAYIPQRIQNNLVRLYSENNNLSLVWSIPEVSINYKTTPALKTLLKSLPENIDSIGSNHSEEGIVWLGSGEGRMLGNHNEQNDSCGEKIYHCSLIWLLEENLWSHIIEST